MGDIGVYRAYRGYTRVLESKIETTISGLGLRAWFRVQGSGLRAQDLEFRAQVLSYAKQTLPKPKILNHVGREIRVLS